MSASAVLTPDGPPGATLARRLGPFDAAAIIVSNVIGSGIFFVPVIVAGLVSSAWLILFAWLAGGVLAFAGAMAYAELATLRPHAGGDLQDQACHDRPQLPDRGRAGRLADDRQADFDAQWLDR